MFNEGKEGEVLWFGILEIRNRVTKIIDAK